MQLDNLDKIVGEIIGLMGSNIEIIGPTPNDLWGTSSNNYIRKLYGKNNTGEFKVRTIQITLLDLENKLFIER